MKCSECGTELDFYGSHITVMVLRRLAGADRESVLAASQLPAGVIIGDVVNMKPHCHHNPFDESDPSILAILCSPPCLERFEARYYKELERKRAERHWRN